MRLGRVRSRRACSSRSHPERRFARVARSEVEEPAFLSVILTEVAAATESKAPYAAHPLSLRRFFDEAEVRAGCAKRSRRACFSVCRPERGRRGDRVEGPLYCPLTFASQVFRPGSE